MDAEGTKVAEFILQHMSDIIEGLSEAGTMQAADKLLGKKLIESQTYDRIRNESIPAEKVRALYSAMRPGDQQSYLVFYEYLKQKQQFLMNQLEEKARNETDSGPPGKKPRFEEPVQMQVQEARHETDSGSSLNFAGYTLTKLLEHVEDQKKMESLAKSLELRLKDGEMKKIESLLKTRGLRNDVHFKHDDFNTICVNTELRAFLQTNEGY
ncbi:uncharacterized protein LOC133129359 isoform X2 [Conger conger]|uniref:uncharacterized protein LOC133129359 isoform X2 n=1 Tax=Conger conger TaxID=82655 RepID=UPI002A5AAC13|nr:uncharacterized protein LOC133129359 isoform X2 [Conger conger]